MCTAEAECHLYRGFHLGVPSVRGEPRLERNVERFEKIISSLRGDVVRADVMCEGNVEGGRSKGRGLNVGPHTRVWGCALERVR